MTKNFFQSSCLRGEQALQQLFEKQNRIEHLNDIGAKRQKTFEIECSNCGGHGHNWLTCKEHCQHCGVAPYSTHLVAVNNKRILFCQKEN